MKKSTLATALLSVSIAATAGPFGLEMGTHLPELEKKFNLTPEGGGVYSSRTVQRAHPDFFAYTLLVTPAHGLCKIVAVGKEISTSVYGDDLVKKFTDLEKALTTKYGLSTDKYDYLREGSVWNLPRDWMMALLKEERVLSTYWAPKGRELPDNITGIQLRAYANSTNSGWVDLTYEFKNTGECMDWLKSKNNTAL